MVVTESSRFSRAAKTTRRLVVSSSMEEINAGMGTSYCGLKWLITKTLDSQLIAS